MKTPWIAAALSLFVTCLDAQDDQQGQVGTTDHVDKNVPSGAIEPADLHRSDAGPPPADAIPLAELDPANDRPLPPGFRTQAVWLDMETGVETYLDAVDGDLPGSDWIAGSTFGDEEAEPATDRSWDSDMQAISSQSYPWSTACRIYFDKAIGGTFVGSGTMIDPQNVITAGHVVHDGPAGTWHENFQIYPAWDGDDDAFGSSGASRVATFTDWADNGSYRGDMGFIRLSRPVGFLTSWLGYGWTSSNSFFKDSVFNLAGYPGSSSCYSGAPHQLYYGWGSYDAVTSNILTADISWTCKTGGVSGAGSYTIASDGNRYVWGCHSHRCYSCEPNTIGHTRMTQGKFDYFDGSFMPDGYSSTEPDIIPLQVRCTGTNDYVAGQQLGPMTYVVGNRSLYDPATDNYPVEVYLSTNDNISTYDTLIQSHSFNWNFGARTRATVNVGSPPYIPSDTASGDYWVGVITNATVDADRTNDDTDGWDAQPITVTGCQVGFTTFGEGLAGSGGFVPMLFGTDSSCMRAGHSINVTNGLGKALGYMWMGLGTVDIPGFGGHFYIDLGSASGKFALRLNGSAGQAGAGWISLPGADVSQWQGLTVYLQCTFLDPGAVRGVSLTNALQIDITE